MEDKIVLDRETFKALAVGTRISILKLLDEHHEIQADIARQLNLSVPAISEHLGYLERADLVSREKTDRKWKYWEITAKGASVLHPGCTRLWVLLATTALAFAGSAASLFRQARPLMAAQPAQTAGTLPISAMKAAGEMAAEPAMQPSGFTATLPFLHSTAFWSILLLAASALAFGLVAGYYRKSLRAYWLLLREWAGSFRRGTLR